MIGRRVPIGKATGDRLASLLDDRVQRFVRALPLALLLLLWLLRDATLRSNRVLVIELRL